MGTEEVRAVCKEGASLNSGPPVWPLKSWKFLPELWVCQGSDVGFGFWWSLFFLIKLEEKYDMSSKRIEVF